MTLGLRFSGIAVAFTLAMAALPVQAQVYPTRPIVVVVPSAAGGPADVAIRTIAEPLSQALGQQLVVDNMAGAGGTLGMARVARAEPDGHTLLIHQNGFAIAPALYRSLPFDTEKDFIAVGTRQPQPFDLGRPSHVAGQYVCRNGDVDEGPR